MKFQVKNKDIRQMAKKPIILANLSGFYLTERLSCVTIKIDEVKVDEGRFIKQ